MIDRVKFITRTPGGGMHTTAAQRKGKKLQDKEQEIKKGSEDGMVGTPGQIWNIQYKGE